MTRSGTSRPGPHSSGALPIDPRGGLRPCADQPASFPRRPARLGPQAQRHLAETLDWVVEQGLAERLRLVLDFHEYEVMARDPLGKKERFLAMWATC